MKLALAAAVCGTALIASMPAHAATVLSDGFEADALGAPQPALTNFNITGGSVDVVGTGDPFGLPCAGGQRCLDLDGTTNSGGTIVTKNSFAFTANQLVTLSFDLAGSQRGDAPNPFTAGFLFGQTTDVLQFTPSGGFGTVAPANGLGLSQVSYGGTVDSAFPYTNFALSFRTRSAGTLQAFLSTGSNDNIGPLLDNVSLSISAVPEPATWMMMISGFGIVGGAMRRRGAAGKVGLA